MADAVLLHVAGEIIKKLGSLALEEIGLCWGVKEDLENLENTVSTIQAVLLDAEEEQKQNNQFRDWLKKLKDALYDADDLLDDFNTEASRQGVMAGSKMTKKVRDFFSSSNQLAYSLKMGHKSKAVRERLDQIAKDRKDFHFETRKVKKHVENRERKQTHSFVLEEEVIGREEDKENVIKLLLESNIKENVSVIPIVGIGGLGKTTLAQFVFNDKRVEKHFAFKMWICVSDEFNIQIIVEKILESINKNKSEKVEKKLEFASRKKPEKLEMDTLQSDLRKEIEGNKYLLVLDDVWNEDPGKWRSLHSLLMGGAEGSKIVVTTRRKKVATITGAVSSYDLKGLSPDQSWSLLKKMASIDQEQESKNPQLKSIGKDIAKKCVGVPLAIKTLGRVLYFKKIEKWEDVMNNGLATLTQQENDIFPILELSYNHLPSHLKCCFAYCSLFPKDYVIDKLTLINLWVAQGLIQSPPTGDQQLEDVGHEYFMDLDWRSFFQEVQKDEEGNVKSCKKHDLMHDLASLVAGTECNMVNLDTKNIDKRARHVSIGYEIDSSWKIPTALLRANKIRTFFLAAQSNGKLNKSTCNMIVSTYKYVRALELSDSNIKNVPRSIGKLKHLRYLDLSWNKKIRKLPISISSYIICKH